MLLSPNNVRLAYMSGPVVSTQRARFTKPSLPEVMQWLALSRLAFQDDQLKALGVPAAAFLPGWKPRSGAVRCVWAAFSYAFAPGNLSCPFHWMTWGRFNPEMQSAAKLLATRWRAKVRSPARRPGPRNNLARLARKGAQKEPMEHNPHWAPPFSGEFLGGGMAGSAGGTAWTGGLALGCP